MYHLPKAHEDGPGENFPGAPTLAVHAVYPDEPEVQRAIEDAFKRGHKEGLAGRIGSDRIFELCIIGARDMEQVGRRLTVLAHLSKFDCDPVRNIRALAELWGVSPSAAQEYRTEFLRKCSANPQN